jgi:hypothetical protein
VVGVVVLLAFVLGGALLAVQNVDTTTKSYENAGFKGGGSTANDGEMEKWGRIVTAIDASKDSEPITVSGAMFDVGLTNCLLEQYVEYRLKFSEDFAFSGTPPTWRNERAASLHVFQSWYSDQNPFGPAGFIDLPAWTFRLRGTYAHGSVVDIELKAKCFAGTDIILASDRIQLLSGWGKVTWGKDRYQVGEEACFTWDVPFVASEIDKGKGWYVQGFHKSLGTELFPRVEITTLTGSKCVTVTNAMFDTRETACENVLIARLTSEIYIRSEDYTTTIDFSSKGPDIKDLKSDKSEYTEGETIVLSWTETPNGETTLPITKVTVSYGEGELADVDVQPGTQTYSIPTAEINATRILHVEVVIQDSGCRPDSADLDITVHRKGTNVLIPIQLDWLIALIVAVVFILIGVFVPFPPWLKAIFLLIGILLVLVAVWWVVT